MIGLVSEKHYVLPIHCWSLIEWWHAAALCFSLPSARWWFCTVFGCWSLISGFGLCRRQRPGPSGLCPQWKLSLIRWTLSLTGLCQQDGGSDCEWWRRRSRLEQGEPSPPTAASVSAPDEGQEALPEVFLLSSLTSSLSPQHHPISSASSPQDHVVSPVGLHPSCSASGGTGAPAVPAATPPCQRPAGLPPASTGNRTSPTAGPECCGFAGQPTGRHQSCCPGDAAAVPHGLAGSSHGWALADHEGRTALGSSPGLS